MYGEQLGPTLEEIFEGNFNDIFSNDKERKTQRKRNKRKRTETETQPALLINSKPIAMYKTYFLAGTMLDDIRVFLCATYENTPSLVILFGKLHLSCRTNKKICTKSQNSAKNVTCFQLRLI
jgi:hypothetical protein